MTRHRPTLRSLLHSRRSTVYIVVSRTLARYALPSMRFKCTLETLRNCTESSPHFFFSFFPSLSLSLHLASFARDDAFSSFDRAPHSTQPLPPPAHARLNVSVQHRVNGKIRKPGRISDAYLLPRFTSRPRKASKKEKERRKEFLKTCGRGRGKIFEKTSPFRQEVVIEYGSI